MYNDFASFYNAKIHFTLRVMVEICLYCFSLSNIMIFQPDTTNYSSLCCFSIRVIICLENQTTCPWVTFTKHSRNVWKQNKKKGFKKEKWWKLTQELALSDVKISLIALFLPEIVLLPDYFLTCWNEWKTLIGAETRPHVGWTEKQNKKRAKIVCHSWK